MGRDYKLATCCYCGAKSTLALSGDGPRRLACSGCGAPLSRLKPLKRAGEPAESRPAGEPSRNKNARRPQRAARKRRSDESFKRNRKTRRDRPKRRPGPLMGFLREIVDEFEDLFD